MEEGRKGSTWKTVVSTAQTQMTIMLIELYSITYFVSEMISNKQDVSVMKAE